MIRKQYCSFLLIMSLSLSAAARQAVTYKEQFGKQDAWSAQGNLAEYQNSIGFLAPGCIKLANDAAGKSSSWTSPAIKLSPGTYRVSAWVAKNFSYSPDPTYGANLDAVFAGGEQTFPRVVCNLSGVGSYARQIISTKGLNWQYYEQYYTVKAPTNTMKLRLSFSNPSQTKGEVWLDDIMVTREKGIPADKLTLRDKQLPYDMWINVPVDYNIFLTEYPLQFDILVIGSAKKPELQNDSIFKAVLKDQFGIILWEGDFEVKTPKTFRLTQHVYAKFKHNLMFSINLPDEVKKLAGQPMLLEGEIVSPKGKIYCRGQQKFGIFKLPARPTPELAEKSHFGNTPHIHSITGSYRFNNYKVYNVWGKKPKTINEILGYYWIRDCYIGNWNKMQPTKSSPLNFAISRLGQLVQHKFVKKQPTPYYNAYVCFNVERDCCSPKWTHKKKYPNLHSAVKLDELGKFYYQFIKHFKDYNKYWAFGNELPVEQNTIDIARIAYQAAKKADPECKVIAPSFTGISPGQTKKLVELRILDWCDIMEYHFYNGHLHMKASLKTLLREIKKQKKMCKIWSTEIGFFVPGRLGQASELIKLHATGLAYGLEKIFWHCIPPGYSSEYDSMINPSRAFGSLYKEIKIFQNREVTDLYIFPHPLLFSYYHVLRHFNFADFEKNISNRRNKLEGYLFNDRDKSTTAAVWRNRWQGSKTFMLKNTGPYTVTDFLGRSTKITPVNNTSFIGIGEDALIFRFDRKVKDIKFIPAPVNFQFSHRKLSRGQDCKVVFSAKKTSGLEFKGKLKLLLDSEWHTKPKNCVVSSGKESLLKFTVPQNIEKGNKPIRAELTDAKGNIFGLLSHEILVETQIKLNFLTKLKTKSGKPELKLEIKNLSSLPLVATVAVSNPLANKARPETLKGAVKLKAYGVQTIDIPVRKEVTRNTFYDYKVKVTNQMGKTLLITYPKVAFHSCAASKTPKVIDGRLNDWDLSYPFSLYAYCGDKKRNGGAGDISGRYWVSWDAKYLYLAVEIEDDDHCVSRQSNGEWTGDGIQIEILPSVNGNFNKEKNYKDKLTLLDNGKCCYKRITYLMRKMGQTNIIPEPKYSARRQGRKIIYELAYPKGNLPPLKLHSGALVKLALIAVDYDLNSRECKKRKGGSWIECFSGVAPGGNSNSFPLLKLIK